MVRGHSDLHLCLSHLVSRETYRAFYADASLRGDYVIMDNSAHEFKNGTTPVKLLSTAHSVRAQEIVVPDVLWDGQATLASARAFFDYVTGDPDGIEMLRRLHFVNKQNVLPVRMMMVPQGKDVEDWRTCLFGLMLMWSRLCRQGHVFAQRPPVIGMSKDYEVWDEELMGLIGKHLAPLVASDSIDVHILGWGRHLWKLNALAIMYPWIRSTDSTRPFVYARKGIMLDPLNTPPEAIPEYPGRPDDHFVTGFANDHQRAVAEHNISVFERLASGRY